MRLVTGLFGPPCIYMSLSRLLCRKAIFQVNYRPHSKSLGLCWLFLFCSYRFLASSASAALYFLLFFLSLIEYMISLLIWLHRTERCQCIDGGRAASTVVRWQRIDGGRSSSMVAPHHQLWQRIDCGSAWTVAEHWLWQRISSILVVSLCFLW